MLVLAGYETVIAIVALGYVYDQIPLLHGLFTSPL
jgi:hypothetical protein